MKTQRTPRALAAAVFVLMSLPVADDVCIDGRIARDSADTCPRGTPIVVQSIARDVDAATR